jgi:site-specific DNA recombinase
MLMRTTRSANSLRKEEKADRARIERRLGEIEREIKRIVDSIVKGMATDALIPRMYGLEAERTLLIARREDAKEAENVIAIHPKALDRYKSAVRELADELKRGTPTEFDPRTRDHHRGPCQSKPPRGCRNQGQRRG